MASYDVKRVADPVHGTIGLSDLEVQVMNTQVFQRLRNVKQLGLAHYVYPGADYSRLSHSLGACHITGRILDSLRRNDSSFSVSDADFQLYRLAGLLHDIGHYPFSHAMEEALKNHYERFAQARADHDQPATRQKPLNHEKVGRDIIRNDPELRAVLNTFRIDPDALGKVFDHNDTGFLTNIISSDLDADRMDYLLRTAKHTGLPYGSVDVDYILSQLRIDQDGRLCLRAKAVRTADHFLLCRYFDYQQISFHKTVAAFELVLKDVISALLQTEKIKGASEDVRAMIAAGTWRRFDDNHVTHKIIELADDEALDENLRLKTRSILERRAPKLIYSKEYLKSRDTSERQNLLYREKTIRGKIPEWAEEFKIDASLWYVWHKPGIAITKVGSSVPVSSLVEGTDEEEGQLAQEIFVQESHSRKSSPIVGLEYSLLKPLSDIALYSLRVYVVLPRDKQAILTTIEERIRKDCEV